MISFQTVLVICKMQIVSSKSLIWFTVSISYDDNRCSTSDAYKSIGQYTQSIRRAACGAMVNVVGNGHGDTSSNPGRD